MKAKELKRKRRKKKSNLNDKRKQMTNSARLLWKQQLQLDEMHLGRVVSRETKNLIMK